MEDINQSKPADAAPVPGEIMGLYGSEITDVWWNAKGREEDPAIGVEINGVRKTFGGYTWNEWWYYLKPTHYHADRPPDHSWYRKKKIPDPNNPNDFTTLDEYVGSMDEDLVDPDTNEEIEIPQGLEHNLRELMAD
tara:strand:+ start:96701 stop:97108 length:408 start_codon:yes stop_codon:yes gene_type:complete